MAGVKGSGGPPPKKSDQRRRRNKTAGQERAASSDRPVDPFEVEPPEADDDWHPVARRWYESLARSGQSAFYANSDWGTAYLLAESMSRELNPQPMVVGKGEHATIEMVELPPKGASLAAWLKAMTALLATEGDRRRASVELQRPTPEADEPAEVTDIRAWKESLNA